MRHGLTSGKTFVDTNVEGLRAELIFEHILGSHHHEGQVFALLVGEIEIGFNMTAGDDEGVARRDGKDVAKHQSQRTLVDDA